MPQFIIEGGRGKLRYPGSIKQEFDHTSFIKQVFHLAGFIKQPEAESTADMINHAIESENFDEEKKLHKIFKKMKLDKKLSFD